MGIFSPKNPKFIKMIDIYLQKVAECMEVFQKALLIYMEKGDCQTFQQLVDQINQAESSADGLRREVEITLYEKALIPESRGDLLGIIESVDKIPNKAQSVVFQLDTEGLYIPDCFKEDFRNIVQINFQTFEDICQAVKAIFQNITEVRKFSNEISKKESRSDHIERELIRKVFQSRLSLGEKILLKDLIIELGNISDKAEDTADRLTIMAAKRLI